MAAKYPVSSDVIDWAIMKSGKDINWIESKLPKLNDWLTQGEKDNTYLSISNIKRLSETLHIPFGYFFLQEPPTETGVAIAYRSIENKTYEHYSRNLEETIEDMQRKQDFVREIRKISIDPLDYVGSYEISSSYLHIANAIRRTCDLPIDWNLKPRNNREAIKFLHSKVAENGILLFKNGVVLNNTRRTLDLEEFRAFVLIDEYAPLIFINTQDALTAQLFSICHELAHIWLGQAEILNDYADTRKNQYVNVKLERLANRVASELLMPKEQIPALFENDFSLDKIEQVAKQLKISQQVVVISLYNEKFISKTSSNKLYDDILQNVETALEERKLTRPGGDYYNTYLYNIDQNFFNLVSTQAAEGNLSYTDAYSLLNIKSGKTFSTAMSKLEDRP